jgi:hypothetical protein
VPGVNCSKKRQTKSSIIEIVPSKFLKERKMANGKDKERRHHSRKAILAPTLIKKYDLVGTTLCTGAITNISLGGVRITIPKDVKCEISLDPQTSKFEIVFTLPNEKRPICLACESCRVVNSEESSHVGAAFIDADLQSYKALQAYLM